MNLRELVERARRAQQEHDQKHDVQLEIPEVVRPKFPLFNSSNPSLGAEISREFGERRQAQIEDENGRDPRD